jgi:D-alanyl-D-alanine carboxypeptidase
VSNKVKSILEKKAQREAKATKEIREIQGEAAVEVESTEVPQRKPLAGDVVFVSWGDPVLIGGQLTDVVCIITHVQEDRVNGNLMFDPTATGMDPRTGQEVRMPSIAPIANVPYSSNPRALTWRFREDA